MHVQKSFRSMLTPLTYIPVGEPFWAVTSHKEKTTMQWQIEKIIEVANQLKRTGSSGASTGERIAAAFVLNRPDYLPAIYPDMVEAWDRLDEEWQQYVRLIKRDYSHLVE